MLALFQLFTQSVCSKLSFFPFLLHAPFCRYAVCSCFGELLCLPWNTLPAAYTHLIQLLRISWVLILRSLTQIKGILVHIFALCFHMMNLWFLNFPNRIVAHFKVWDFIFLQICETLQNSDDSPLIMTPVCKYRKPRRRFYTLSCFYFLVNFSDLEGLAMPQVSKSEKTFGVRLKAWFKTGKAGLLRNQVNAALNLLGPPSDFPYLERYSFGAKNLQLWTVLYLVPHLNQYL